MNKFGGVLSILLFMITISSQEFLERSTIVEPLVVAAVGRVARIGELYDARTERFLHVSMAKDNLNSSVIQAIENKHSKIEYLKLNTLDEKLSALSVAAELKISVLCGLIQVGGSGKFVNDKKHSSKSVQVSLAANMLTEYEHVDFTNKNERKLIDMDILAEVDATHVVVGVQWGGNVFISVEDSNYEGSEYQSVQGSLSAKLEMLFASVSVGGSVSVNETLKNEVSKYSFEIYGDILPAEMPVTLVDAVALMKSSAKLLTDGNLGKGKAMSYTLLPLDFYRQLLGVEAKINSILRSINELTIEKCVKWFDDTNFVGQKVSDLLTDRKNYQNYIAKTKLDRIMTFGQQFDSYRFQVKASLAEHLQNIRSGNETVDQLIHILDAANNHEMARELIDFEQFRDIQSEIKFLKFLADRQINILDKDTSFQEFMLMHFNKNIYTFFYSIEFPSLSEGALVPFLTIVANKTYDSNGIFVAIKIDVLRDVERQTYFNFDGPTRLRLYKNQHCIVDNFLINTVVNSTGDSELWSLEYMKAQIINVRTEVAGAKIVVSGNVASITEIKNKLVPIGFIYVQYPDMSTPTTLWPSYQWTEITSRYAGLFFRAEGGSSRKFTEGIQSDISPRIISTEWCNLDSCIRSNRLDFQYSSEGTSVSDWIGSGGTQNGWTKIRFTTKHKEVIPKNRAIRIWQRSK